jgi:ubiquinone/menaquinone biosynthesis C-methylase UbiE
MVVEWYKGKITEQQAALNKKITDCVLGDRAELCETFNVFAFLGHWSRVWEFSWILSQGFQAGQTVLDAGGGASPLSMYLAAQGCHVHNVDLECRGFDQMSRFAPSVTWEKGDIRSLPYDDKVFDFVVCCSVLEHVESPLEAVKELRRVCGGKLIITMDVTTSERWNHTVDESVCKNILTHLGLEWVEPHGAAAMRFQEHDHDGKPEEGSVISRVLGLSMLNKA